MPVRTVGQHLIPACRSRPLLSPSSEEQRVLLLEVGCNCSSGQQQSRSASGSSQQSSPAPSGVRVRCTHARVFFRSSRRISPEFRCTTLFPRQLRVCDTPRVRIKHNKYQPIELNTSNKKHTHSHTPQQKKKSRQKNHIKKCLTTSSLFSVCVRVKT